MLRFAALQPPPPIVVFLMFRNDFFACVLKIRNTSWRYHLFGNIIGLRTHRWSWTGQRVLRRRMDKAPMTALARRGRAEVPYSKSVFCANELCRRNSLVDSRSALNWGSFVMSEGRGGPESDWCQCLSSGSRRSTCFIMWSTSGKSYYF